MSQQAHWFAASAPPTCLQEAASPQALSRAAGARRLCLNAPSVSGDAVPLGF